MRKRPSRILWIFPSSPQCISLEKKMYQNYQEIVLSLFSKIWKAVE